MGEFFYTHIGKGIDSHEYSERYREYPAIKSDIMSLMGTKMRNLFDVGFMRISGCMSSHSLNSHFTLQFFLNFLFKYMVWIL